MGGGGQSGGSQYPMGSLSNQPAQVGQNFWTGGMPLQQGQPQMGAPQQQGGPQNFFTGGMPLQQGGGVGDAYAHMSGMGRGGYPASAWGQQPAQVRGYQGGPNRFFNQQADKWQWKPSFLNRGGMT